MGAVGQQRVGSRSLDIDLEVPASARTAALVNGHYRVGGSFNRLKVGKDVQRHFEAGCFIILTGVEY
jgi:hypothetical protein